MTSAEHKPYFAHESAYLDDGCRIGTQTKIWHYCHIMKDAGIGDNCILGQNVFIGKKVRIGNRVKIQNNVSVFEGVECEDEVFIGPSAVFTNVRNPRSAVERKDEFAKTLVKKGATIGANATILCGISVGRYAFIGAGAVVLKSVFDFELVTGNPAQHKGWMSKMGYRLHFNDEKKAVCPGSGEKYILKNGVVSLEL